MTFTATRRGFLGAAAAMPAFFAGLSRAAGTDHDGRILVVLELAGGNDGLNTVVPIGDDAYYKARPGLAIGRRAALKIEDGFGLHPGCTGLHRLYKDGQLAIVNGCGYPKPNLSHFTSMEWWHTAAPHGGDKHGWLGRLADARDPKARENYIVNISGRQSRAVASARHSPVVFKDPAKFGRDGSDAQQKAFEEFGRPYRTDNPALTFVNSVSRTATAGASLVRAACAKYRTPVDYGSDNELTLDLKKVAALIAAKTPTRLFYLSQGGYDSHAAQAGAHQILMVYLSDALAGFLADMKRIGRADDVAVLAFSEFGRRVQENASKGTDHGTAGPMFLLGKKAKGGMHGKHPSLTDLDAGNLRMTTDFRRVYATAAKEWLGFDGTKKLLKGDFPTLGLIR